MDAFLGSYEWRTVRMLVLERDGAKCACCGATAASGERMNVDHIKPRRLYPHLALDASNLQVLCESCNHGKGNKFATDWRRGRQLSEYDFPETNKGQLARIVCFPQHALDAMVFGDPDKELSAAGKAIETIQRYCRSIDGTLTTARLFEAFVGSDVEQLLIAAMVDAERLQSKT